MIGLGSNRLSVCRRGGMRVTQAGRGGMEWLGVREPLWAQWWLPYSRQAGEALKAQFPTQWPTIRDYGFAHPEIVGYMNAYAPEDAKIAYSLVPTLGVVRWLVGNGSAYINTGLVPTADMEYRLRGKNSITNTGSYGGARNTGYGGVILAMNCIDFFPASPSSSTRWNYSSPTAWDTYDYHVKNKKATVNINGSLWGEHTFNNATGTTTWPFHLFEINNNGNHGTYANGMSISMFEMVGYRYMIPFIHKDNGVNKYGMIDLLTGTFYGDATGNNGFTISETPAS